MTNYHQKLPRVSSVFISQTEKVFENGHKRPLLHKKTDQKHNTIKTLEEQQQQHIHSKYRPHKQSQTSQIQLN